MHEFRAYGRGWREEQILSSPHLAERGHFGRALSISGGRIALGAPHEDVQGTGSGATCVFPLDTGASKHTSGEVRPSS